MNYNFWKRQQVGSLLYRRAEMVIFLCLVTFNIWLNVLTGYILSNVKWLVEEIDKIANMLFVKTIYDATESTGELKMIVTLIGLGSAILSLILWWQIIKALLFMVGDYLSIKRETGKSVIGLSVLVAIVNIITFIFLYSIWWPGMD